MRAFVGVPLPPLEPLASLVDHIGRLDADVRLVDPHRFHLTLIFLADVPHEEATALMQALDHQARPAPFEVHVRGVGAFPSWRKFNVLWAGIDDPQGGLRRLHDAARDAWTDLGHAAEDRAFRPHLTLARRRGMKGLDAVREVLDAQRDRVFGTASVDRVQLYRSTLTPEGARYDVLEVIPL